MIITELGTQALDTITRQPLNPETASWELECVVRDHPEYGEVMDGIGMCLCGARHYPEGEAMRFRLRTISRELEELAHPGHGRKAR